MFRVQNARCVCEQVSADCAILWQARQPEFSTRIFVAEEIALENAFAISHRREKHQTTDCFLSIRQRDNPGTVTQRSKPRRFGLTGLDLAFEKVPVEFDAAYHVTSGPPPPPSRPK